MPTLDELDDHVIVPAGHAPRLECHIASGTRTQPERLVITPDLESADRAYARGQWISIDTEHTAPVTQ